MEMDAKVLEALALLQQAGRMDLVKEEALAPGRPARRASAGVAAAVTACSPPRRAGRAQVRGIARGPVRRAGMSAAGAGKGRASRRGLDPGSFQAKHAAQRPGGHPKERVGGEERKCNPAKEGSLESVIGKEHGQQYEPP
ncbi:hypothetical protein NDU88_007593 [Pleurodeles waltl]|uniref:Uncharacterized protein n=1 Tax=Pleurodeles waltl TaxID=8319 RepID=A0AAV7RVB7_PLEWA|nr:hypothetical protein NDU88_007593 [Pleurodeles waltl]